MERRSAGIPTQKAVNIKSLERDSSSASINPNVGVQRLPKAVRCNDGLGLTRSLGYDALIVFGIEDERANFRYCSSRLIAILVSKVVPLDRSRLLSDSRGVSAASNVAALRADVEENSAFFCFCWCSRKQSIFRFLIAIALTVDEATHEIAMPIILLDE